MIPLRTDVPLRSTPWMNWALIAANVVMFFIQRMLWPQDQPWALGREDFRLWQLLSYQFLHGSGLHLLSNMLFLYIFGNNVNDRMGQWWYLAFYLAGGAAAGVGHVLSSPSPVIGASGAVSAVTAAYLVLLPRSHVTILYFWLIIGTFELPSMVFIILSFMKDFILGFSGQATGVAHLAHLSGAAFGFVVCLSLLGLRLLPRDPFDLFALIQRWNRRRQYRDMVARGYNPFGFATQTTQAPADPRLQRIQDLRVQISRAIDGYQLDQAAGLYLELRKLDPAQVLSQQNQLDVANQLFARHDYAAAADAYEGFVRFYPKYGQIEQVQLMLGLLYARYLNQPDKARLHLSQALQKLSHPAQLELAQAELARLNA